MNPLAQGHTAHEARPSPECGCQNAKYGPQRKAWSVSGAAWQLLYPSGQTHRASDEHQGQLSLQIPWPGYYAFWGVPGLWTSYLLPRRQETSQTVSRSPDPNTHPQDPWLSTATHHCFCAGHLRHVETQRRRASGRSHTASPLASCSPSLPAQEAADAGLSPP